MFMNYYYQMDSIETTLKGQMKMSKLALVKQESFGTIACDFFKSGEEILMTREQIGLALEYSEPNIAIYKIHERHSDRFSKFSLTKMVNGRETYFYNSKGVYEICRWSRQKKADEFMDWTWSIIDGLRNLFMEKSTEAWKELRESGKSFQKDLNDVVKEFVEYATLQGSSKPTMYYQHFAKLSNRVVGIDDGSRDMSRMRQLMIQTLIIDVIKSTIKEGMASGFFYKDIFKLCKERCEELTSKSYLRIAQ